MKKYFLATLVVCVFSMPLHAVEFGIGASIKQNENTIFAPIKFNNKFKIECLVFHSSTKQKNSYANTDLMKNETDSYSIGMGFYFTKSNTNNMNTYYGIKIGYTRTMTKYTTIGANPGEIFVSEFDGNGHYIMPAAGFEFFPIKNIFIGAEIGYNFYNSDGSDKSNSISKTSFTEIGTTTNIIIRYYF